MSLYQGEKGMEKRRGIEFKSTNMQLFHEFAKSLAEEKRTTSRIVLEPRLPFKRPESAEF